MLSFDYNYGSVVNAVVTTDENGRAIFEYIAPEGTDYDKVKGQDTTITAVFEQPLDENSNVVVDEDAAPVIILTQEFVLQFR